MVTHSPDCAGYAQKIFRVSDGLLAAQDKGMKDICVERCAVQSLSATG
jgi:hypothetical protein